MKKNVPFKLKSSKKNTDANPQTNEEINQGRNLDDASQPLGTDDGTSFLRPNSDNKKTRAKKSKVKKKAGNKTKQPANNAGKTKLSKILPIIAVALAVAIVVLLGVFFSGILDKKDPDVNPAPITPDVTVTQPSGPASSDAQTEAAEQAKPDNTPVANNLEVKNVAEAAKPQDTKLPDDVQVTTIDPATILNKTIPSEETLVKEEIDKLIDQSQLLESQAKTLGKQVSVMEEISNKKSEEIELLEKQIAQLEAESKK